MVDFKYIDIWIWVYKESYHHRASLYVDKKVIKLYHIQYAITLAIFGYSIMCNICYDR